MKIVFPLLMLFSIAVVSGQKLELGKVSVDELTEKTYPADTTAPAAIIFKKANSKFRYRTGGFFMEHEYEFRIKIYKKEGLTWGTFSVPYFTGYKQLNDDHVEFSNAVTYNLNGNKIVKTKTGREGRFKKNLNESWDEATLVLANVQVGSVIEFKYTLRTEDITEFPTFYFQYDIPVKQCTYNTVIPEYFQYKPVMCGFGNIVNMAKIVDESQSYQTEHKTSGSFSYRAVSRDFFGENIPALKAEPYVDNLQNYRSAVKHELERTQFPGEEGRQYSTTWEAVALDIYKNENFGKPLRERQYFEPFVDPHIKAAETPMQKATAVFNYVQNTMTWDKNYGYYVRKGLKKAFAEKTGNVAEINLMLVAMLNHAGIAAYPVLVSTVENGIAAYPTRTIFNYVVASAEIGGKQVLFDATSKNVVPGILPFRDLNWYGWQIANDGKAKQIDLVPKSVSMDFYTLSAKIDASGNLAGKAKVTKTDYCALAFRDKYKNANPNDYLSMLESNLNGIEITNYKVVDSDDKTQPIEETFEFKGSGVEVIGDKIYIDPMLFLAESKNPFVSENRFLPVYYGFPKLQKYFISIEIPQGYTVASLPKSVSLALPQNLGGYKFNIKQQDNVIQLNSSSEINMAIVASDFYPTLKNFYNGKLQSGSEKIVLTKI